MAEAGPGCCRRRIRRNCSSMCRASGREEYHHVGNY